MTNDVTNVSTNESLVVVKCKASKFITMQTPPINMLDFELTSHSSALRISLVLPIVCTSIQNDYSWGPERKTSVCFKSSSKSTT